MAPSINALPRESFFLMQISTRIKTIITLTIAGMFSTIDISFYLRRLQKLFVRSRVLAPRLIHQIANSLDWIKAAKFIVWRRAAGCWSLATRSWLLVGSLGLLRFLVCRSQYPNFRL
jgi:hypothetical protein